MATSLFHLTFRAVMAGIGAVFCILSALLFYQVHTKKEQAMVSFQLHPEQTVTDFRLLYTTMLLLAGTMAVYAIGGITENTGITNIGRTLSFLFATLPIIVFYRWWSRFT